MNRLTEYICSAAHGKRGRTIEEASKSKTFCRGEFEATGCVERLAAYEDTGLEPDEIPHLKSEVERLTAENAELSASCVLHEQTIASQNQQIATLKKALELMLTDYAYHTGYSGKDNAIIRNNAINSYIQKAQQTHETQEAEK